MRRVSLPLALLAAGCGDSPPSAPYALPAGSAVRLEVVVREDLAPAGAARRLEVSMRGRFDEHGSLRVSVTRARLERMRPGGTVTTVASDVAAAEPSARAPEEQALARIVEALHGASLVLAFDPVRGVTAVEGLDAALDAAASRHGEFAEERDGLRGIVSDDAWRRALAACGLCQVPAGIRGRGLVEREVSLRIPGRGDTTAVLTGRATTDREGSSAVELTGVLRPDAAFTGSAGAPTPSHVGAVNVEGVAVEARTSYPRAAAGPPTRGECSLTVPFAGGLTLRRTTTFTWVGLE